MTGELGYALPPAIRRIAANFRLCGWIGLWGQVVVGILSTLTFTTFLMGGETESFKATASLFATPALALVFVGVFWSFRYVLFGRKLATDNPDLRPKPKDAARIVRIGTLIALVGMGLSIMGAEAIIGPLLIKAFDQGSVRIGNNIPVVDSITAGDILSVFSVINATFTHFIGLCISLWLQFIVNR